MQSGHQELALFLVAGPVLHNQGPIAGQGPKHMGHFAQLKLICQLGIDRLNRLWIAEKHNRRRTRPEHAQGKRIAITLSTSI